MTLNPAFDRFIRVPSFGAGEDHRTSSSDIFAGGKGVNGARALKGLGVKASAMLFPCARRERMRVNTTVVDAQGCVTRLIEPGAQASAFDQECFLRLFKARIKRYRFVIFAGSLPPGMKPSFLVKLVALAKAQGLGVAVDASDAALKAVLGAGPDLVKPNRQEVEALLGFCLSSRRAVGRALRSLAGYGIKDVLISLGQDGLAGFDGCREVFARVPVVVGRHTLGCGDAALAGFVAARLAGKDFAACMRHAAACGTAAVGAHVPGGICERDVRGFERNIVVEERKTYGSAGA